MLNIEEITEILKEAMSSDIASNKKENAKGIEITADQISSFSSEKLCSIIATNRYIKFNKQIEVMAMQELSKRRMKGDNYDFESKIEEYGKAFTPITANIPGIVNAITGFMAKK